MGSGAEGRARSSERERHWLTSIRWWLAYLFILLPTRLLFEWIVPPLLTYFWHNGVYYHLAQDDRPVYEEVRCLASFYPYGAHFRETVDILVPDRTQYPRVDVRKWSDLLVGILRDIFGLLTCYPRAIYAHIAEWLDEAHDLPSIVEAQRHPAILFVHGGGYCAVNACIQHHQTTSFVRAGYSVYSINYPHAPEDPFPAPIISTLRFLHFMRKVQGHEKVTIIGESAGGGVATMAALLVTNPAARREFKQRAKELYGHHYESEMDTWEYPEVACLSAWYGILDPDSWQRQNWLWRGLQWTWDCHRGFTAYFERRGDRKTRQTDPYLSICCAIRHGKLHEPTKFPPTYLFCGDSDPLGLFESTKLTYKLLKQHCPSVEVQASYYNAGHAFIGLNPFVLYVFQGSKWRDMGLDATMKCVAFVKRHHQRLPDEGARKVKIK